MAEQLANLASTTLASNYTAGSGSIVVTSATGFPTQGTFSVTILNGSTVVLIFRVTSVSGTTFTGASEGPDSNATAGFTVVGTMLTVAAITQIKLDAGNFIQPTTPPISGNFSNVNFNTGSGVVTTRVDNTSPVKSTTIIQQNPSGTTQIVAVDKSPINALFTISAGFSYISAAHGGGVPGLWLSDGSAVNLFYGFNSNSAGLLVLLLTDFTGASASIPFQVTDSIPPSGPLVWLQIKETASARNYSISSDGVTYTQAFTESNTAHFTTAKYGFGINIRGTGNGTISCYSFTETTP